MVGKQAKLTFLTFGQRQEIIELFKYNEASDVKISILELAKRYNVSVSTIRRLRNINVKV